MEIMVRVEHLLRSFTPFMTTRSYDSSKSILPALTSYCWARLKASSHVSDVRDNRALDLVSCMGGTTEHWTWCPVWEGQQSTGLV